MFIVFESEQIQMEGAWELRKFNSSIFIALLYNKTVLWNALHLRCIGYSALYHTKYNSTISRGEGKGR